ncbi:hypothetical protein AVM15_17345 [Paraclostridium benzoelyticum]|nr:hypothetical protein AVM15_17345 [Paraclostridium benzoelyticum]
MGIAGLAFATSISAIVTIILLFISLRKKIGQFGGKEILVVLIKSIVSAGLMSVITIFVYKFLGGMLPVGKLYETITLAISIGSGALTYGICIILLRVDEVNLILETVKNKIKR